MPFIITLLSGCVSLSPMVVEVAWQDGQCVASISGMKYSTFDINRKIVLQMHRRKVHLNSHPETPYICTGEMAVRLQRVGVKITSFTVDGAPIPTR
jgi:hypothetical protein